MWSGLAETSLLSMQKVPEASLQKAGLLGLGSGEVTASFLLSL